MGQLKPTELPQEAPKLSKKAKWRKLANIQDCRLALASVIKKTYDGAMPVERAAVCITGLRTLAAVLKDGGAKPVVDETAAERELTVEELRALANESRH